MEENKNDSKYSFEVSFTLPVKHDFRYVDDSSLKNDELNFFDKDNNNNNSCLSLEAYNSDGETSVSADSDGCNTSSSESPMNAKTFPTLSVTVAEPSVDESLSQCLGVEIHDLRGVCSVPEFINSRIENGFETGSFLVTNLSSVVQQYQQWRKELPMVEPFYAVKCNPDQAIVRLLASLGCSFDCATMGEIDLVCNGLGNDLSFNNLLGKANTSVVYANPAKMQHMLEFAIENGVRMTVIDGEDELLKIAETPGFEQLQVLLRLTTDDRASVCRFSKKFGCPVAKLRIYSILPRN